MAKKKAAKKKVAKKKVARKKVAKKKVVKKKAAKKKVVKKKKRKANPALLKPMKVSDDLAAVVGKKPLPRGKIVKKVWDYIKKKGLQDKKNKRMINPDAVLGKVIGKKQISMFKMTAKVSKHIS